MLWVALFGLPVVSYTLKSLIPGYFQCNMDVGEIFLNLWLNKFLHLYAGVDVGPVRTRAGPVTAWETSQTHNWEWWCRNFIGLRDLSYRSIQMLTQIINAAYGYWQERDNLFRWSEIWLNLLGAQGMTPPGRGSTRSGKTASLCARSTSMSMTDKSWDRPSWRYGGPVRGCALSWHTGGGGRMPLWNALSRSSALMPV